MENMNETLEGIIKELQDNDGHKKANLLTMWSGETWSTVSKKLTHYGLINFDPTSGLVTLTKNGWEFESFEKERLEKQIQKDLISSNLSAAKATKNVSEETGKFYQHQKRINNGQILLAIAIFLSTVVSTIVACWTYQHAVKQDLNEQENNTARSKELEMLKDSILQYRKEEANHFRQIKDALKIP